MCPLRFLKNCVPTFGMSQSWCSFHVLRPYNDINKSRPATVLTGKQHLAAQEFPLSCVIGENNYNTCENNYNTGENYYNTGENNCDVGENYCGIIVIYLLSMIVTHSRRTASHVDIFVSLWENILCHR